VAHAYHGPTFSTPLAGKLSRRAMFRHGGRLGLSLAGSTAVWPQPALAAPVVTVAAPRIMRIEECVAPVAVAVTLSGATPGVCYEASGDIMEADEPDGEDDFCCTLNPNATLPGEQQPYTFLLTREVMAIDLGLQRGRGPAADETSSSERVALFARVWVRDLARGDRFGPWESPRLIAVPNPRLLWTRRELPGSELMTPRGGASFSSNDRIGLPLPPQACIP
jgi:hypothetical protein